MAPHDGDARRPGTVWRWRAVVDGVIDDGVIDDGVIDDGVIASRGGV